MKLLVFALTPPPHHGQSYMVKVMLEGFGGDHRFGTGIRNEYGIECYHVNSSLAAGMEDMGRFRPAKILKLLGCCWQAIQCRFRYGVRTFYYIPAPSVRGAVLRDWIVMALCRPFFSRLILHWHAAGLGEWLEQPENHILRAPTRFLLGRADLSIHLAQFTLGDADYFRAKRSAVVGNGIPDPCPEFETQVLPMRLARRKQIESGAVKTINVLFLSLCMKEKGLHDAVRGIVLANRAAEAQSLPYRFQLKVAGNFLNEQEDRDFSTLIKELGAGSAVQYAGFLDAEHKREALLESDILCFPTYYYAEAQPVVLLEAMAFGLTPLVTRWRAVPELFPPDYPGLVDVRQPQQVASALLHLVQLDQAAFLRKRFVDNYLLHRHLDCLAAAIRSVEG